MFTGIVEEMGSVRSCAQDDDGGFELIVDASVVLEGTALGDSIAVNGVCLTVTALDGTGFTTGLAHVDSTGVITEFRTDADALWVHVEVPSELMRYIVTKGYVSIDGTSLTVVDVGDSWFNVTLVAYTQAHIVLPGRAVGDAVNIEVDVLGKYVERLVMPHVAGMTSAQEQK